MKDINPEAPLTSTLVKMGYEITGSSSHVELVDEAEEEPMEVDEEVNDESVFDAIGNYISHHSPLS